MIKIFNRYFSIKDILFFFIESLLIFFAVLLATHIRYKISKYILQDYSIVILKIILVTFVYQMSLYYNDMYNTKIIRTAQEIVIRSLQAVGAAAVILSIIYYIIPDLISTLR